MIVDALMKDPRTEDAVLEVIHDRGMVTLQGVVDNSATKQAAHMITTEFPGVVSIMNELAVQKQ
jgi:osmotically-inducible protein OsmY